MVVMATHKMADYMGKWYVELISDENVATESLNRFDLVRFGLIMDNISFLAQMAVIFLYKMAKISISAHFAILALKLLKFFLVGPEVYTQPRFACIYD